MTEWRDIEGYDGKYQVSSLGEVLYVSKGTLIKPSKDTKGYTRVNLYLNGKCKTKKVHRLVGCAFLDNGDNLPQINHMNGIKWDNRRENLEWCDQSHNQKHAYALGLKDNKGIKNGRATIDEKTAVDIKNMLLGNLTHREIADIFQVSIHVVANIKNKKAWAYL